MQISPTIIEGVVVLTPTQHRDARGVFCETWNAALLRDLGIERSFVQDNQSVSEKARTVRGLHMQVGPEAQAKLVRCGRGAITDVAVDARIGSPTFGRWVAADLSDKNRRQMLIPEGCLHGFVTRMPDTEVLYKCSAGYAPDAEVAVRFDDPDLGIDWRLDGDPVLSARDAAAPSFVSLINRLHRVAA